MNNANQLISFSFEDGNVLNILCNNFVINLGFAQVGKIRFHPMLDLISFNLTQLSTNYKKLCENIPKEDY